MRLPWPAEDQGGSHAATPLLLGYASNSRGTNIGNNWGGKRRRQEVNDSTYLAMDLVSSGTHITPASQAHCTSVVINAHSNIPTIMTSRLETKQESTVQHTVIVKLPAKHSASSPSWVKALNDKSPTIVTPIITVQPDGAGEQVPSAPPDEMAPWSPRLAGSYEGIATAKPPPVMEITVRLPKSKSLIHQGALAKTKDLIDPVQETPTNRNEGAWTRQEMPKVSMVEVPDEEDNTSFWRYKKANLTPSVALEVTQLTVAKPSDSGVKTEKVPYDWLKTFGAKWTLHRIIEARTESEVKAILEN